MKKVIDGKRYDTDAAAQIASASHGGYANDFRYYTETLYLTKNGAWFLRGEGGPMSPYGKSHGDNSWSGGETLRPLSASEARAWLEKEDEHDALEKYFGADIVDA